MVTRDEEIRLRAYRRAQRALAELEAAVVEILATAGSERLRNSQVGRLLGIHPGHVKHQGHISRTVLEMLHEDCVAEQETGGTWHLRRQPIPDVEEL
jgi:DNA polymerase/3'-5' exonuclease PolX